MQLKDYLFPLTYIVVTTKNSMSACVKSIKTDEIFGFVHYVQYLIAVDGFWNFGSQLGSGCTAES